MLKKRLSSFFSSNVRIGVIFLVGMLIALQSYSQLPAGDLSAFKVDQLTTAQVQDIYSKAQAAGISDQDFYNSLTQRGLPVAELTKLKQKIAQLPGTKKTTPGAANGGNDIDSLNIKTEQEKEYEKKLFGYALFQNAASSYSPNLNMPTPKNYVIGPGDVLVLQVYGVAQGNYSLTVNPDGNVTIPDIGVAHIAGFTIEAAKSLLQNRLATRYSGMNGNNANTFLQVTLGNIRTIKISVVGEVTKPGSFNLPSYTTLFNALFSAGGPTVKGTFRNIQVYRANKLVAELDLYDFLVNGKTNTNIRLEDDDVILIRPATGHIEVSGQVRTPGIFEIKGKETFTDIIKYTGGFTEQAYKERVSLTRKGLTERQVFDLPASQFSKANMNDGDSISVTEILDRFSNRVQVSGSVYRPGPFALSNGMTVQELIQKAGGLKGDAFLKRALLYRTRPDLTQEVINIDLTNINGKDGIAGLLLEREDVLSIVSIYDIKEEYYVQINGEVNSNGVFPYADDMTVGDLILKAGGFKYSASGAFIEIVRRVDDPGKVADIITVNIDKDLKINDTDNKIILKPFDQVFVRATPGFTAPKLVSIDGEVLYKGIFAIEKKEMRISDLLIRAGGLTKYAYPQGATLIRRTKSYVTPTLSEQENANLGSLKKNLNKDPLIASSESNKQQDKRIDSKIKQNAEFVDKEKAVKDKETLKQNLVKDNATTVLSSNAVAIEEKDQELVAIDLSQIISNPGSDADLVLKDGDVLNIPEKLETVSVKGGVLFPVSVRYESSLSFKEYVNRAGGYSTKAIKNKSYVLQANGRVQRVKTFLFFKSYPKVEPGAEIFVPATLLEKQPFNYINTVSAITGLITSTLTIIFLLRTL